ncbi:MAG: SDR family oxidoreductase [Fidelibacterota bacterium]
MRKLLITGGSGLIGGSLLQHLSGKYQVYATYMHNPITWTSCVPVKLSLGNLQQIKRLISEVNPDVIIHTAAVTDLDECERNKDRAVKVNVKAVREIAQASVNINSRLIFFSTDMVFSGDKGWYSEDDIPDPINFYGVTKAEAEGEVMKFCKDYIILRSALVYGKRRFKFQAKISFSDWIVDSIIRSEEIPIFMDQYRTPIGLSNLCRAVEELLHIEFTGVLHVAGAERVDRYTFARELLNMLNLPIDHLNPIKMENFQADAKRPRDLSFDITLARDIFTIEFLGCREGLREEYLK